MFPYYYYHVTTKLEVKYVLIMNWVHILTFVFSCNQCYIPGSRRCKHYDNHFFIYLQLAKGLKACTEFIQYCFISEVHCSSKGATLVINLCLLLFFASCRQRKGERKKNRQTWMEVFKGRKEPPVSFVNR